MEKSEQASELYQCDAILSKYVQLMDPVTEPLDKVQEGDNISFQIDGDLNRKVPIVVHVKTDHSSHIFHYIIDRDRWRALLFSENEITPPKHAEPQTILKDLRENESSNGVRDNVRPAEVDNNPRYPKRIRNKSRASTITDTTPSSGHAQNGEKVGS